MRVYLMRHGPAIDRESPSCPPDPERPLSSAGAKKTRAVIEGLRRLDLAPDLLLSSPYVRAWQTADLVRKALGTGEISASEALLPLAQPDLLLAELRRRKPTVAFCVGHLPHLDLALAAMLAAPQELTSLKKAGVACVELPARGSGLLLWLATPSMLRLLGD